MIKNKIKKKKLKIKLKVKIKNIFIKEQLLSFFLSFFFKVDKL